MELSLRKWLRVCFLNLLIVSLIGVVLRYKIAFSLPIVDQKHLLHGHSHFAFSGWITQVLMVLMVHYLSASNKNAFASYRVVLYANLFTAYGMLFFFPIQGYGLGSIIFSTLSIFVSWFFVVWFWRDLNRLPEKRISHNWFKAALLFNAISSLGAFGLAFMMASKIVHQNWYLGAQYYFLHFQYNGWFFFAAAGLLMTQLEKIFPDTRPLKIVFWLFGLACVPAFFLSALWMPIPVWMYVLVVLAAIAQFIGWLLLLKQLQRNGNLVRSNFTNIGYRLLLLSGMALTIKLLLQVGSTHPALSQLAFGFRPIVIGYLHLVLLAVISIFIIGYIVSVSLLPLSRGLVSGIWIFVAGIIINEILLMTQGVAGLSYVMVPHVDLGLLITALIMFSGILLMNLRRNAPGKI